jgi:acetolactate synthase-1/2/3 large subunit
MDNNTLGMVRQWQTMFYNARYSQTNLPEIDFCMIAKGHGYKNATKVETVEEFEKAFKQALKNDGPSFIHCVVDNDTMVLPMVPPGASIDQIMMTRN